MARERTGSILKRQKGKKITWWARLTYIDDQGKRRDLQRRAENMAHAKEIVERLAREHDKGGARVFETENKTFADLCAYYEERYLIEAVYHNERKVAGLRDAKAEVFDSAVKDALWSETAAFAHLRRFERLSFAKVEVSHPRR